MSYRQLQRLGLRQTARLAIVVLPHTGATPTLAQQLPRADIEAHANALQQPIP
ncbi:MAG: hypothetical protein GTO22_11040 [Gemmatimonadales bacterium]|nr:hypothetical protein [Gemmatimonadales bacterium]